MRFSCSAWISAVLVDHPARAPTLMRCAVGFMAASALASIRLVVSGVSGQVRATMSAWRQQLDAAGRGRRRRRRRRRRALGSRLDADDAHVEGLGRAWPAASRCGPGRRSAGSCRRAGPRAAAISEIMPRQCLPGLVVAARVQMALERQDQRHGVLGHGMGVDAGGVGEADAVRAQHVSGRTGRCRR